MKVIRFLFVIVLTAATIGCNSKTDQSVSETSMPEPTLKEKAEELVGKKEWTASEDSSFLIEAYQLNLQIIRLNEMAVSLSKTKALLNFAGQSVQYYQNLNGEIELMEDKFTKSPPEIAPDETKKLKALQEKSGKDFENAYLNLLGLLINEQKNNFEKASEQAFDKTVKNWATKITSNLNAHSTAVEELAEDI